MSFTVYDTDIFCQCGEIFSPQQIFELKEERTMFVSECKVCGRNNVAIVQAEDGEKKISHEVSAKAKRMLKREKRNIIRLQDLSRGGTYGLCYGLNTEIRNKKGEVTQIRHYSCDFYNKRRLERKIITK